MWQGGQRESGIREKEKRKLPHRAVKEGQIKLTEKRGWRRKKSRVKYRDKKRVRRDAQSQFDRQRWNQMD